MSDTHECIDKAELAELRRRAAFYGGQKLQQWEPPEGKVIMLGNGDIDTVITQILGYRYFGMEFTSIEQAEEASPLIRAHNRLIRYVQEHGGLKAFKTGRSNWTVNVIDQTPQTWCLAVDIGAIWMTKSCAESLAAGMKDGSVVL